MRYEQGFPVRLHPPSPALAKPLLEVDGLMRWHISTYRHSFSSGAYDQLTVHWSLPDGVKLDSAAILIVSPLDQWTYELLPSELERSGSVTSSKYYGVQHDPLNVVLGIEASRPERPFAAQAAFSACIAPHDVCINFQQPNRRLFAHSAILSAASPYFKTLLESDFAEGARKSVENGSAGPSIDLGGSSDSPQKKRRLNSTLDFDDSDDDPDEDALPSPLHPITQPMHTIEVSGTSYSTYAAILVWIQTQHISFAPLLSTIRSYGNDTPAVKLRAAIIASKLSANPLLPPPVSPKSIYRAAHLFELPALRTLALSAFSSQLTPQNVAEELYSDVAACYDEIKEVCLSYAVKRWSEVKESEGLRRIEAMEVGELPSGAVGIGLEIARRLSLG